jgi:hypothetical protein
MDIGANNADLAEFRQRVAQLAPWLHRYNGTGPQGPWTHQPNRLRRWQPPETPHLARQGLG